MSKGYFSVADRNGEFDLKDYVVGFFGGSITAGAAASSYKKSWSQLVFNEIAGIKPDRNCKCFNASISGTGSEFGVFRIKEHLLKYNPDVIFIEFAVNDSPLRGENAYRIYDAFDYLIAQTKSECPDCAIILVYTAMRYGKTAADIHRKIAEHYGLAEIDAASKLTAELDNGKTWDDLLPDGLHPTDYGHRLYADAVISALLSNPAILTVPPADAKPISHRRWNNPSFVPAEKAKVISGFSLTEIDDDTGKHIDGMVIRSAMTATEPGAVMEFDFSGRSFGIYHRIGRKYGKIKLEIDNKVFNEISFFYPYPSPEFSGEFLSYMLSVNLSAGKHTARITTLEHDENSSENTCQIAAFLCESE
ncbi:MAG: SGNH/GDSL hydrolase family protein [Clostridia bacterium]|nr:SGNH/GDSL hydrolase family protein [Clostridia bacterium]